MCRSRYRSSDGPQDERTEREKFYKHLRMYLLFNGLFLFFTLKNGGNTGFLYMTFFWGIAVVNHYFKVFGSGFNREGHDDYGEYVDDNFSEPFEEKRKKPKWRNKDLV